MRAQLTISGLLLGTTLAGCVTRSEHERLLGLAAEKLRQTEARATAELAAAQAHAVSLQNSIAQLTREIEARDAKIGEHEAKIAALTKQLDEATAMTQALGEELKKAGRNVDKIAASLAETKARLEELRKSQEAAQKRAELLKSLMAKLKRMIDAGELKVLFRDGRMVLQLRNDVLFDSGRADVKAAGKDALREVAQVLATLTDRKLQVVGHTDNKPMASSRFASNWELSAERAIAVVKLLIEQGVKAEALSAAGYSEFDPVAPNDTDDARAKNRRIEIVLLPNLAEIVNAGNLE